MTRGTAKLRVGAALAVGAVGVHQLRYLAAYGGDAQRVLHHEGHAYLGLVTPVVGLLVAWTLGALAVRIAAGASAGRRPRHRLGRVWTAASVALLAVYCVQEVLEGVLAPGHAGGFAAVLGHGGWVALPLALAMGGLVALALRGADAAEDLSPPVRLSLLWLALPSRIGRLSGRPLPFPGDVLARHLAGRAPPLLSGP